MRAVVALGGNAILHREERGTLMEQQSAVAVASRALGAIGDRGIDLVITHGNGPQIGRLLVQNLTSSYSIPAMPLDVLGAESQGEIGYLLQQALSVTLAPRLVLTLVTRMVVDEADPAFANPTKPIGPYMLTPRARVLAARGIPVARDPVRGGWRRVVASPRPIRLVEEEALRCLLGCAVPIAAGGGGAPVVAHGKGWRGVEAVIDKDLAAAVLARAVGAEMLLILTDVEAVLVGRGTDRERSVRRMTVSEAKEWLEAGEFPPGTMGPKVEAAVEVVERGGRAIIAPLERAVEALDGETGTEVVPG